MISEDCLYVRLGSYLDRRREPHPTSPDDAAGLDEEASPAEADTDNR